MEQHRPEFNSFFANSVTPAAARAQIPVKTTKRSAENPIKALLRRTGLTRHELARRLGCSVQLLDNYSSDIPPTFAELLIPLAREADCTDLAEVFSAISRGVGPTYPTTIAEIEGPIEPDNPEHEKILRFVWRKLRNPDPNSNWDVRLVRMLANHMYVDEMYDSTLSDAAPKR